MTYCLGIKLKEGRAGIADTRITAGSSTTIKKKITVQQNDGSSLFMMTSGLRPVRDNVVHDFQELKSEGIVYDKLYKAVNGFGAQIKRVASEDKEALTKSGYKFDLNAIVGGQLKHDEEHKLFLLYAEGNWIELDQGCPYVIIGNSGQGKAILNRVIHEDTSIRQSLKAGFLSFDSTRVSSNDVEFPKDLVLYKRDSFSIIGKRYEKYELEHISRLWAEKLKNALDEMP